MTESGHLCVEAHSHHLRRRLHPDILPKAKVLEEYWRLLFAAGSCQGGGRTNKLLLQGSTRPSHKDQDAQFAFPNSLSARLQYQLKRDAKDGSPSKVKSSLPVVFKLSALISLFSGSNSGPMTVSTSSPKQVTTTLLIFQTTQNPAWDGRTRRESELTCSTDLSRRFPFDLH